MLTEEALKDFRDYVVSQSRRNLTIKDRNVSKKLWNSISGDYKTSKNSFELSFSMEEYGMYLDQGVKGKFSGTRAPNSPFKFGSGTGRKGGLTDGINKWVRQRKFQFRNRETGKFMSYEQTASTIIHSIYTKGTKPTLFFTKPFENAFKRLPDDLIEKYGLDVEDLIQFTTKRK